VASPSSLFATDLDGTLLGDVRALADLQGHLTARRPGMAVVYITGRSLPATLRLIETAGLITPDVIVAGVGTAIHHGPDWAGDTAWARRLAAGWQERRIRDLAGEFPSLLPQGPGDQHAFKCSYRLAGIQALEVLPALTAALEERQLPARLIYSSGRDLDIVPPAAGKAGALTFLVRQWGLPWSQVVACGDSGNDRDMLGLPCRAVLVGNCTEEMRHDPPPAAYRARAHCAAGISEGLRHFGWLKTPERIG
jgi:sucrose-6F-phosphate phosphohydrolase